MAETLTPQQREAVYNRGGKLLVSAAAGSGKTKVLVDRLLSYITDEHNPANVDDFLIITYTKSAAAELRAKIAAKLSERIATDPNNRHLQRQMHRLYLTKISTVHAFCADLLHEYAYLLDIPADFRVADENECNEIQQAVIEQLMEQAYVSANENPEFQSFVNTQGFGRDDRQIADILLKVYNSAKCHLNPDRWLSWCVDSIDADGITDAARTVWGKYLVEDLRKYLDLQIDALQRCCEAASAAENMEKAEALLKSTISQLLNLRQAETWDEILLRKNIDYGRLVFSKKCTDDTLMQRIKAIRNACKKGLEKKLRGFSSGSEQILADLRTSAMAAKGLVELVKQFSAEFDKRKQARHILDFGDLEHKALDLLKGKSRSALTQLALQIGNKYREIMVDEYQDSNGVQDAIFEALTIKRQNCFLVGDVKQSIYQFRLADPSIFIEKYNSYALAENAVDPEGRKILLSSNFRSSNGVIQCVNDVFKYGMSPDVGGIVYDEAEMLREGIPHIELPEPEVELYGIDVQEDTYSEEAAFVASRIAELLDGNHFVRNGDQLKAISPEDIVILLRSPGSVGYEFADALMEHGIRVATGSGVDLLQTEEVIVLRSLLQIISNPMQDIPLTAVMLSRIFGFTADELAAIRGRRKKCSVYESLSEREDPHSTQFITLLSKLRKESRLYTVSQLLQRIFFYTSMDSIYAAMDDGLERKRNLHQFCQIAAEYEAGGRRDLTQFLSYIEAMEKKGLVYAADSQTTGAVTIMSIHKSKGLEFPVVFLCGLSRSFNQESAHAQVLCHKELGLGLSCVDVKNRVRYPSIAKKAIAAKVISESISEELRVLYVAMTRPKDRLIMTYAAHNIASDLLDIASRIDMSAQTLLTGYVSCPGEWVMQCAMQRTEAGAFFAVADKPDCTAVSSNPWRIELVTAQAITKHVHELTRQACLSASDIERLQKSMEFTYEHNMAISAHSKQTATQMKGRIKDIEAAENTTETHPSALFFRKPSFVADRSEGKEIGTAVHKLMQYIRYDVCLDTLHVEEEIDRLVRENKLSLDEKNHIDITKITAFFDTEIGRKVRSAKDVLREFKFSILCDYEQYIPELAGEQFLLQGVVDCAVLEADGITVIDFKTDLVTDANLDDIVARYAPQVSTYANALERIFKTRIKAKYLYLFSTNQFVDLPID